MNAPALSAFQSHTYPFILSVTPCCTFLSTSIAAQYTVYLLNMTHLIYIYISLILVGCLFTTCKPTVHMETFLTLLLTSTPLVTKPYLVLGQSCLNCFSVHAFIQSARSFICVPITTLCQLELFEPTTLLQYIRFHTFMTCVYHCCQFGMMLCGNYHEFVTSSTRTVKKKLH